MRTRLHLTNLSTDILDDGVTVGLFEKLFDELKISHVQYYAINIGRNPSRVSMGTFSPEWCRTYHERGYGAIDPVLNYVLKQRMPCVWSNVPGLTDEQQAFMTEAAPYVGRNGITVPFGEPPVSAALSITTLSADDSWHANLPRIIWTATSVGQKIHRSILDHINAKAGRRVRLTSAQSACLHLLAEGMDEAAIASVTRMSRYTVRRHVEEVRRKLNAKSPAQTVAKAAMMGILAI